MNFLFLFLDGIGLGADIPEINPLSATHMPHLQTLLDGERLVGDTAPLETASATLLSLDACLGVEGLPQSATGQATLLTGQNIPSLLGYHYGPKPNPAVAQYLRNGNLFHRTVQAGRRAALLNAYPPRYFSAIQSGRRLYSAIPMAAVSAGVDLKTADDLARGDALAADFTAHGWHHHLHLTDTPLLTPDQAGHQLGKLAQAYDFAFFDFWLSDDIGHHQLHSEAHTMLETFDQVLGGLLDTWDHDAGLILITSDHGNFEDLSTRRHTANPVPALLIGAPSLRRKFFHMSDNGCQIRFPMHDIADLAPAIRHFLNI
jgi:hypothetical protein